MFEEVVQSFSDKDGYCHNTGTSKGSKLTFNLQKPISMLLFNMNGICKTPSFCENI
jgi:hypothetical protein